MQFAFSEVISKFSNDLGVNKLEIVETFNKPDSSQIIGGTIISVKNFGPFHLLVTFEMDGLLVRFMNAYKIFPKLIENDIKKSKPLDILSEFMDKFGLEKDIPGVGKKKIFVDVQRKTFFQGILDIEKYNSAV